MDSVTMFAVAMLLLLIGGGLAGICGSAAVLLYIIRYHLTTGRRLRDLENGMRENTGKNRNPCQGGV